MFNLLFTRLVTYRVLTVEPRIPLSFVLWEKRENLKVFSVLERVFCVVGTSVLVVVTILGDVCIDDARILCVLCGIGVCGVNCVFLEVLLYLLFSLTTPIQKPSRTT